MPEARRADGACHETLLLRCSVAISQPTWKLWRFYINFVGECTQPIFVELETTACEGVGFQYIAAGFEEAGVDFFDDGRFGEHKIFVATFGGLPPVVFPCQLGALYVGAHAAVIG